MVFTKNIFDLYDYKPILYRLILVIIVSKRSSKERDVKLGKEIGRGMVENVRCLGLSVKYSYQSS